MYFIKYTNRFSKDLKLCQKRGMDISALFTVVEILANNGNLPLRYKPHRLTGNHAGQWECHIKPDWLLVWEQNDNELTLLFLYTGTHSDLFGK